jgi:hypothetical protein
VMELLCQCLGDGIPSGGYGTEAGMTQRCVRNTEEGMLQQREMMGTRR